MELDYYPFTQELDTFHNTNFTDDNKRKLRTINVKIDRLRMLSRTQPERSFFTNGIMDKLGELKSILDTINVDELNNLVDQLLHYINKTNYSDAVKKDFRTSIIEIKNSRLAIYANQPNPPPPSTGVGGKKRKSRKSRKTRKSKKSRKTRKTRRTRK
jgi:hypothetical protein